MSRIMWAVALGAAIYAGIRLASEYENGQSAQHALAVAVALAVVARSLEGALRNPLVDELRSMRVEDAEAAIATFEAARSTTPNQPDDKPVLTLAKPTASWFGLKRPWKV